MYLLRHQRQPVGRHEPAAADLEPANVLSGDLGVGANVHDVDPLDPVGSVPQVIESLRDHSARDERLPETDLVGYQETAGRIRGLVEALEGVLDGVALESLETLQHSTGVGALARSP